jgi:ankyrin repeat protein
MRQRIFWALAFVAVVPFLLANLAYAQSDIQPVFTPANSQKFDARSTPAKATSDDESALASKGYFKIGTISATHLGTKEDPEITRQLESAILQKTAEVGGDIVRFSKVGIPEERDVPTGKTKTMKTCLETKYIPGTPSTRSCVATSVGPLCSGSLGTGSSTRCVNWYKQEVPVTKRETDLVSEGTVWRYDPKFAANVKNQKGETPLSVAAMMKRNDVVEQLLAHGADINARNNDGLTPLHEAALGGYTDVAELLLAHGADINATSGDGETPLHSAAWSNHRYVVELLLAHGADVNVKDNKGRTPLHAAASGGDKEVVEVLLAHGADVNARDGGGMTPLHSATWSNHRDVVELLLVHGADVNVKQNSGETPLHVATMMSYTDIGDLLRQHGADIARKVEPEEARKAVTGAATAPSMLGKNINSAEMKTWLSSLGQPEILRSRLTESYYYNFKSKGISLFFNNANDTLRGIIFYSEGADDYRQFQGDLPFGLSFQNTRSEIESILGPPDKTDDGAGTNIWTSYNSKGIRIKYNTVRTDDMNARMYFIIINTVP